MQFLKKFLSKLLYRLSSLEEYKKLKRSSFNFKYLGANPCFSERILLKNEKYISIGDNFFSMYNLRIEAWDEYMGDHFNPEIVIGDNVSMNTDVHIGCINSIIIKDNVMIASRVYISDHSHGNTTKADLDIIANRRRLVSKGPVVIEENVWIGEGVCIFPGVTIGKNSVVGANAVVTKSFSAYSIIGGVPAKLIKTVA